MGTPDFAVPSLAALNQKHEVVLVVTRPDAVRGRGKKLEASSVKAYALDNNLEVLEATRMNDECIAQIEATKPDLIVVAAYGCILPDEIIDMAPLGCINVHASTLPRWRGAAPIQRAIMEGDERAGVSIMKVVQALDAGDYCRQADVEILDKTTDEVMDELAHVGADELLVAIDDIAAGSVNWEKQDESLVTIAKKVFKKEMRLDPSMSASVAKRYIQASSDAAPARVNICGKGVRIMKASLSDKSLSEGEVLEDNHQVYLGFSDGAIELLEVKPDGKKEMLASAWAAGLRDTTKGWDQI